MNALDKHTAPAVYPPCVLCDEDGQETRVRHGRILDLCAKHAEEFDSEEE